MAGVTLTCTEEQILDATIACNARDGVQGCRSAANVA